MTTDGSIERGDGADRRDERIRDRDWRARRAKPSIGSCASALKASGPASRLRPVVADVADDADDRSPGGLRVRPETDPRADRGARREEPIGQRPVDDDNRHRGRGIAVGDPAPLAQRDLHRRQVSGRRLSVPHFRRLTGGRGPMLDRQPRRPPVAVERQIVDHGRGADAGNRGQARSEVRVELRERGAGLVARPGSSTSTPATCAVVKPGVTCSTRQKLATSSARADHEDDRRREFPDDERIAEDARPAPCCPGPRRADRAARLSARRAAPAPGRTAGP